MANNLKDAEKLLHLVEAAAKKVGLGMNASKTKAMLYNESPAKIQTLDGSSLDIVEDFKYLGAWMASSEKDFNIRKAQAWKACNRMSKIWKSKLARDIKMKLFTTTVESVLMYGAETWTLTAKMERALNGCYTRMLRKALNVPWQTHTTNKDLYGSLRPISARLRTRRLKLAGHCIQKDDEAVGKVLLWQPKRGRRSRGPPRRNYIKQLTDDTGLEKEDIKTCMLDRTVWKAITEVRPTESP